MGKYLEIAKKFEAQQRTAEVPSPHTGYRQAAETVQRECYEIDPAWLIDSHPRLWTEMKNLDLVLVDCSISF